MKSKPLLLAPVLVLLIVGSSAGFAAPPQLLTLSLSGAIFSSGSQQYSHQGGTVVAASILGQTLDPAAANLHYSLGVSVTGTSVTGSASFNLHVDGHHNGQHHGGPLDVQGQASIVGMIPAETFPLGCTFGTDCTSAIAAMYLGVATVQVSQGGSQTTMTLPMSFESAFLNPFGGPIFMASDGGEIFIESNYTMAQVKWSGIQLGGTASGSFAGGSVSGQFAMNVNAVEDLKNGFEVEHGAISFLQMSNPALNAAGTFDGRSTIPQGSPCPSSLGLPPGTCTLTGFMSAGHFSQSTASDGDIEGTYNTVWTVPAVAFASTVSATVKSGHH